MRIFLFMVQFTLGMSIFMLALKMLGDTLSSILGFRLRALFTRFTSNKINSLATGLVATALVQSSSIVNSTMVVLVDSGVLAVPQALGVILGANIGTTLTAQIVALPVESAAIPLVLVGLVVIYIVKRPALGKACLSLGAVFFGLNYTTGVLAPLLGLPAVQKILLELTGTPIRACVVGVILTSVVQSSGAVTGLVVSLAGRNLLTLSAAVGVALGSNVGTVVTTLIASLGRSRASKATALGDFLFNLVGVLLILPVFPFFLGLVGSLSMYPGRQVAHAHTLFNIITALATLPALDNLAKLAWSWAGIRGRNKNT